MQVERADRNPLSGERVSNALVTCPGVGDTRPKGLLIPHGAMGDLESSLEKREKVRSGRGLRPIS